MAPSDRAAIFTSVAPPGAPRESAAAREDGPTPRGTLLERGLAARHAEVVAREGNYQLTQATGAVIVPTEGKIGVPFEHWICLATVESAVAKAGPAKHV